MQAVTTCYQAVTAFTRLLQPATGCYDVKIMRCTVAITKNDRFAADPNEVPQGFAGEALFKILPQPLPRLIVSFGLLVALVVLF